VYNSDCLLRDYIVLFFQQPCLTNNQYPFVPPHPPLILRCGIPVVIMGETGCGKTRLIRYMCDLARQGMDRRNMLIMKVSVCTSSSTLV